MGDNLILRNPLHFDQSRGLGGNSVGLYDSDASACTSMLLEFALLQALSNTEIRICKKRGYKVDLRIMMKAYITSCINEEHFTCTRKKKVILVETKVTLWLLAHVDSASILQNVQ